MKNLTMKAKNALNNENGGPNVEALIGIAVALAVGVGFFLFGKAVFNWFNGSAGETVSGIETPEASAFSVN